MVPKNSSLTGQIDIPKLSNPGLHRRTPSTCPLSLGSIEISDFPLESPYLAKQTISVRLKDLTPFYVHEAVREDVRGTVCGAKDEGLLQFLDFFLYSLIVFELGINQRTHV